MTTIQAASNNSSGIAYGNTVGSNISNMLLIGIAGSNISNLLGNEGVAAILASGPVPGSIAQFDCPIMLVVSAIFLFFLMMLR